MLQVILREIPLLYLPAALIVLATNWQNPRDFISGKVLRIAGYHHEGQTG